jgi:hypothetical protein
LGPIFWAVRRQRHFGLKTGIPSYRGISAIVFCFNHLGDSEKTRPKPGFCLQKSEQVSEKNVDPRQLSL